MQPTNHPYSPDPAATTGRSGPRVATAPVNWVNADLAAWSPTLSFSQLLDQMVAAGYDATEYGADFPTDPDALRAALDARGVTLCGVYHPLPLADDARMVAARAALDRLIRLFAAVGCRDINLAFECTPERIALAGHVPADGSAGLADEQWRRVGSHLNDAGRLAAAHGLRAHFHNHVGSHVETPAEIERLLAETDPAAIDLCYDCGHHAYGGGDPLPFVERHRSRIGYVHLKDVDPAVLADSRARRLGFHDALRRYVFCEFGHGMVDIPAVVRTLTAAGYTGWLVVEQDTTPHPPTQSARANRAFLRDRCNL